MNGAVLRTKKLQERFILNVGYVRQLAVSFYSELTIRENLLFSMNLQSTKGEPLRSKLERVEQVIEEVSMGSPQ